MYWCGLLGNVWGGKLGSFAWVGFWGMIGLGSLLTSCGSWVMGWNGKLGN